MRDAVFAEVCKLAGGLLVQGRLQDSSATGCEKRHPCQVYDCIKRDKRCWSSIAGQALLFKNCWLSGFVACYSQELGHP